MPEAFEEARHRPSVAYFTALGFLLSFLVSATSSTGACKAAQTCSSSFYDAISDNPSTYLALCAIVLVDDFLWFAPGDTAMITAGIMRQRRAAAVPRNRGGDDRGILGDNISYFLGRRFARASRTACSRATARASATAGRNGRSRSVDRPSSSWGASSPRDEPSRPSRAEHPICPTALLLADSLAALAWATYTALLGFAGGRAFRDALWQPLLIGLAVAVVLGAGAELLGRDRGRAGARER